MNKATNNIIFIGLSIPVLLINRLVLFDTQYLYLRTIFSLVFLVFIPGLLIMLMLKIRKLGIWEYLVYTIGLSIAFLMFGGLAVNWILPWLHITDKPLSLIPLLISFDILLSIFGFIAYKRNRDLSFDLKFPKLSLLNKFFFVIPIFFPILSILGATTLNNGGQNYITMIMIGGIAVFVLLIVLFRNKLNEHVFPYSILFISIALLLMYSLRSWHIIGWDINQELVVFQTTLFHQKWNMNYFPGQPYNACLSITILPTIFSKFINISNEYILKLIFNILFAFVPVAIYILIKKYFNKISAFFSAFFFMCQVWFYEQMPAITRQEIGVFFYVIVLVVLLDNNLKKHTKIFLLYFFSAGLIVSHYSTAYIWLVQVGLVIISSYFFTFLRIHNFKLNFIKPSMLIILVILLLLWEVVITQSFSGSYRIIANSKDHLLDAFLPAKLENSIETVLYGTPSVNTNENILIKYNEAAERSTKNNYQLYSKFSYEDYYPYAINDKIIFKSKLPYFLSDTILFLSKISKAISSYLLLYTGFGVLFILHIRKKIILDTDFVLLTLSSFSLVLLMLVMPNLQANYNFTRLYMQALVLASILPLISADLIFKYINKYQSLILSTIFITAFIFTVGFIEQFTGGYARTTLYKQDGTFDKFYIYDAEVKSAEWLSKKHGKNYPIFADILAGMRLSTYSKLKSNPDVFPNSISLDGYIYMSYLNVNREYGFTTFDNNSIVFNYPTKFINREKNLIYNNGGSIIFK